jgi:hypothetical protein
VLNEEPHHEDVWGNGGELHAFFTSVLYEGEWSASRPGHSTHRKEPPVPTGFDAGWVLQPVWTQWRREKNPCLATYTVNFQNQCPSKSAQARSPHHAFIFFDLLKGRSKASVYLDAHCDRSNHPALYCVSVNEVSIRTKHRNNSVHSGTDLCH